MIQQIVHSFLENLAKRDLEALCGLFGEDVDWFIPGNEDRASWLGKRQKRVQVKNFFEELWSNTEPIDAKVHNILTDTDVAIIAGEFKTKMLQTNKVVDSLFFIQLHIRNDEIVKYRLLEDSYAVSEALLSQKD